MKSADCRGLLLCLLLLLLQAVCLLGQEKSFGEELAALIRDADDVRVVLADDVTEYTAYQAVRPEGRQALAQAFADAKLTPVNDNGSNDPGDLAVSSYMIMNVRHKGELVGYIRMGAYFAYVVIPGKTWYKARYKDAPYADDTVEAEKSFIEKRARAAVLASAKQGGWKKVEGSLKGFLNVELPD